MADAFADVNTEEFQRISENFLKSFGSFKFMLADTLTFATVIRLATLFMYPPSVIEELERREDRSYLMIRYMEERGQIQPTDITPLLNGLKALDLLGTLSGVRKLFEDHTGIRCSASYPSKQRKGEHVKGIIGKEGGLLEIVGTGVRLEIPPGALEDSQLIEMGIVRGHHLKEPVTFYSNMTVIVELLPNHLELQKEVILTLPHSMVLKDGCQWKANVYRSHHDTGSPPRWEVNPDIKSVLMERCCVIWLKNFSWETFDVDEDTPIIGKRITIFAAKRLTSTNLSALLDVGFYVENIKTRNVLNQAVILCEDEAILYKTGSLPLVIALQSLNSDHWSCGEEEKEKKMAFAQVACVNCKYRTFELKGDPKLPEDGICHFKIWQKEEEYTDLRFHLKSNSSSLESSSLNRKVQREDVQELSELIGDKWKVLARKLDFTEAEIQNFQTDHDKQQEVALQMLTTWMQKNGDAATYKILGISLIEAGRTDLGQKFLK